MIAITGIIVNLLTTLLMIVISISIFSMLYRMRKLRAADLANAITEHAVLYAGGSMLVRPQFPELEDIFPLEKWIVAEQKSGAKVYRRRVIVVDDWTLFDQMRFDASKLDRKNG